VALDDPAAAPGWVREALGSTAAIGSHPFTALNTAQFTGGIALRIAARAQVEAPILLTLATAGGGDTTTISHPRVLVVVEEGASADLLTAHVGDGAYLANPVTEITVGTGARLGHSVLQAEADAALHLAMTAVRLADKASYEGFVL